MWLATLLARTEIGNHGISVLTTALEKRGVQSHLTLVRGNSCLVLMQVWRSHLAPPYPGLFQVLGGRFPYHCLCLAVHLKKIKFIDNLKASLQMHESLNFFYWQCQYTNIIHHQSVIHNCMFSKYIISKHMYHKCFY